MYLYSDLLFLEFGSSGEFFELAQNVQKTDVPNGVSVGEAATGDIPLKLRWDHNTVGAKNWGPTFEHLC